MFGVIVVLGLIPVIMAADLIMDILED